MLQYICNHSATLPRPGRGMIPMTSEYRTRVKHFCLLTCLSSNVLIWLELAIEDGCCWGDGDGGGGYELGFYRLHTFGVE